MLLDADATVDESKLRRAASGGVPRVMRPLVWRMLLGVSAFKSSETIAAGQKRVTDYERLVVEIDAVADIARQVRNVLKRSRSAYQPVTGYERRSGRQGSTSGESYEGEGDDDEVGTAAVSREVGVWESGAGVAGNGRVARYVRGSRERNVRVVDRDVVQRFVRIIGTYVQVGSGGTAEFDTGMVWLAAPFVEVMGSEADSYFAFAGLMARYGDMFTEGGSHERVSEFLTLLRALHQDLWDHLVAEEVEVKGWVAKWLKGLLVGQLPRKVLMRLWDAYFAQSGGGLDLHPFVCLVFVDDVKAELLECEDGERIAALLGKFRPLDIDYVIAHALTIREQLRERGIL